MTSAPNDSLRDDATDRCNTLVLALARLLARQAVREMEAVSTQKQEDAGEQEIRD